MSEVETVWRSPFKGQPAAFARTRATSRVGIQKSTSRVDVLNVLFIGSKVETIQRLISEDPHAA